MEISTHEFRFLMCGKGAALRWSGQVGEEAVELWDALGRLGWMGLVNPARLATINNLGRKIHGMYAESY